MATTTGRHPTQNGHRAKQAPHARELPIEDRDLGDARIDAAHRGLEFTVLHQLDGEGIKVRLGGESPEELEDFASRWAVTTDPGAITNPKASRGFLKKVWQAGRARGTPDFQRANAEVVKYYSPVQKAKMGEGKGTTGGYIVPEALNLQLLEALEENSFIRPRATVVPMTTRDTYC